jgi:hypothetical protein
MVFKMDLEDRLREMGPMDVSWTIGALRKIHDLCGSKTSSNLEFSIQLQQPEGTYTWTTCFRY